MMRLGYFEKFKFGDAVLLSGDSEDVRALSIHLEEFLSSQKSDFPIHSIVEVVRSAPIQLFAVRSSSGPGFRWLCTGEQAAEIQERLSMLTNNGSGHQYFDLINTHAKLIVSVGEYDAHWWNTHG